MKKRISILLVVAVLVNVLCSFSIVSAASDGVPDVLLYGGADFDPTEYGFTMYEPGETRNGVISLDDYFIVNVAIKDFTELAGFGIVLDYDEEVLSPMYYNRKCMDAVEGSSDVFVDSAYNDYYEVGTLTSIPAHSMAKNGYVYGEVASQDKFQEENGSLEAYMPLGQFVFKYIDGKTSEDLTAGSIKLATDMTLITDVMGKDLPHALYYAQNGAGQSDYNTLEGITGVNRDIVTKGINYTIDLGLPTAATEAPATEAPTAEPTPAPTAEPTATPAPTDEPTPAPTDEPTPDPTDEPTPAPTAEPTATPAPTAEPTEAPATAEPTAEPSSDNRIDPNDKFWVGGITTPVLVEGNNYEAEAVDYYGTHVIGARKLHAAATVYSAVVADLDQATLESAEYKESWSIGFSQLAVNETAYVAFKIVAENGDAAYYTVTVTNKAKDVASIRELYLIGVDLDSIDLEQAITAEGKDAEILASASTLIIQAKLTDYYDSSVRYLIGADFETAVEYEHKGANVNAWNALFINRSVLEGQRLFIEVTAQDGVTTQVYTYNFNN